ncbi:MAG: MBL fold metallo-hydrolase [Gammaproteobacteria bacterium]|nr:MBL fold metallo-hydrolase [Gammaproteobacteria bacterium]|tara:strand:+ start:1328 stop:2098 length:771 start_codon:yes stop_codon:yes gene_type:complete
MPVRFASLGSGSKGNSAVFDDGVTRLLIDLGFSLKETLARLSRLRLSPENIDGILVTHEHADHVHGVGVFARKYHIPVFLTHGSYNSKQIGDIPVLKKINCGQNFEVGSVEVQSVPVPHDAKEPCQYVLTSQNISVGVLTDLGHITQHVKASYRNCDALLLEFNHDLEMLRNGPYSDLLKRRISSDFGHLNNLQASEFLRNLDLDCLKHLVISHLSEKNNSLNLARAVASKELEGWDGLISVADQKSGFDWINVAI